MFGVNIGHFLVAAGSSSAALDQDISWSLLPCPSVPELSRAVTSEDVDNIHRGSGAAGHVCRCSEYLHYVEDGDTFDSDMLLLNVIHL